MKIVIKLLNINGGNNMNKYRTHNCNELSIKNVGEEVKLARMGTNH